MTVGADNIALGDFIQKTLKSDSPIGTKTEQLLSSHMVKIHALRRKAITAVSARNILELIETMSMCLLNLRVFPAMAGRVESSLFTMICVVFAGRNRL
jgi:hypothetical protein